MLFPLFDLNPHRRFPLVTLLIIAINVAVTVWSSSLSERQQNIVALKYGFVPRRLSHVGQGQVIQARLQVFDEQTGQIMPGPLVTMSADPGKVYPTFLTTMFLHGGWMHLIMNMWMLWVFGNNIEDRLGHLVYLAFYLVGGVVATLTFWATAPEAFMPVIGASGAVAAVLGAYAVTFPTAKVRTLVFIVIITVIDIPALVWLGIWFITQLYSGFMGLMGVKMEPVAFWSHIGGFVAGMILMPLLSLGSSPTGKDWRREVEEMFRFEERL